ncbi:MAG TPA: EamA family transporter [Candidatus Acetothermia bacterium]|nr:EamA family transporter [Candidatus Acetothermia bacterium]
MVLVDRYVRRVDYRGLLLVQVGTVAALSTVGALLFESLPTHLSGGLTEGILVTGVLATALALYILNRFQSYSTAAYTAIILTMEPVFAALFGAILLGETLGPLQIVGAVVIVVSTLIPKLSVRPARTGR